jgi:hypothetical protein
MTESVMEFLPGGHLRVEVVNIGLLPALIHETG